MATAVPTRPIALALSALGILGHTLLWTVYADGEFSAFNLGMIGFASLPYAITLALALRQRGDRLPALVGVAAVVVVDAWALLSIFNSSSSTAAIGLLFVPVMTLVFALPLGLIAGWGLDRLRARNAALSR